VIFGSWQFGVKIPANPCPIRSKTRDSPWFIDLQRQGLTIEQIRDQLFKRESALAAVTGGDFSIKNLIASALETE